MSNERARSIRLPADSRQARITHGQMAMSCSNPSLTCPDASGDTITPLTQNGHIDFDRIRARQCGLTGVACLRAVEALIGLLP